MRGAIRWISYHLPANGNLIIIEYAELEGTHEDHRAQPLTPHQATLKINPRILEA